MIIDRLVITGIIGLLSIACFEVLTGLQRQRATRVLQLSERQYGPRILYFRSDNCSGCAVQSQQMAELEVELQQAVKKIDVEAEPQIAEAFGVMLLPTTLVMDTTGNARFINYGVVNSKKLSRQWKTALG